MDETPIEKVGERLRRKLAPYQVVFPKVSPRSTGLMIILTAMLIGIAIPLILWSVLSSRDWGGLALNLGTEVIGAVLIYLLLFHLLGRVHRKEELIRQLGSKVNDLTLAAAEELRHRNWLCDGSLRKGLFTGANLKRANLEEADFDSAILRRADLSEAVLLGANLSKVYLVGANLHGADLRVSTLPDAYVMQADLTKADLSGAYLCNAALNEADLSGADLTGADLTGADLAEAKFNRQTVLPDGTKWTPETDVKPFEAGKGKLGRNDPCPCGSMKKFRYCHGTYLK